MKRTGLVFASIILSLNCLTCSNDSSTLPEDSWIDVRVHPKVELFYTIHRLARTGADDTQELPNYIRDIENYFAPYGNHRAVKMAKKLWETHRINLSALSTLVVYLGDPPELIPLNQLDPLPSGLDSRWTADVIPGFIEAVREFSRDSEYMVFFGSQKQLFDRSIRSLYKSLNDKNMLDWFRTYFGYVQKITQLLSVCRQDLVITERASAEVMAQMISFL